MEGVSVYESDGACPVTYVAEMEMSRQFARTARSPCLVDSAAVAAVAAVAANAIVVVLWGC
jgi:hypothetical protein